MAEQKYDLCVIGAGSGGLSVAAAGALLGVKVVLLEKGLMGGDCLNYGCVPSKAIIAAAKQAQTMRKAGPFGVKAVEPNVDFKKVHDHIHSVIGTIAPHDSVERFEGMGVDVITKPGKFLDHHTVQAGTRKIKARYFVVATGSHAGVPPIPGLDKVPYLTNETIFDLKTQPKHLIIIGGGPIGTEMAQAHNRLGSRVTLLDMFEPLSNDDPELTKIVIDQVVKEGVNVLSYSKTLNISKKGAQIVVEIEHGGKKQKLTGSHLLVAAGRVPNVKGLNLEAAGVQYDRRGIKVDKALKTTNKRVYAIGDVAGGLQFTHMANYHAGLIIRNALFKMPVKENTDIVPWVTYTDPELAHVGLNEKMARERHGDAINVLRWPYAENDRAQAERKTNGFVKVVTDKKGNILGASIVGHMAGELILPWVLALTSKLKIKDMTAIIVPYPTFGEISKRAAQTYYSSSLSNPWIGRIIGFVRFLDRFKM